jgi:pSer/pThr/pTyr-binding forkhead associated (FHA) protein
MSGVLIVRWPDGEYRFESGSELLLGRDPKCDVVLDNPNVSRIHAAIRYDGQSWTLRDQGSAQGTFQADQAISESHIDGPTSFVLGAPRVGVAIDVFPEAIEEHATRNQGPSRSDVGDQTFVPDAARPGGDLRSEVFEDSTVVAGGSLRVQCADRTYSFEPGSPIIVGRDRDADIVSLNPTVSRRHAILEHDGEGWKIEDTGSRGGMFVDGRRVASHRIIGSLAVLLGDVDAGERLVLVAGGQRASTASERVRRVSRSGTLPLAAAAIGLVAIGVAVLALVFGPGASGNDLDRLARGVVRLTTSEGMVGSGTIIDAGEGLILTNAHVAAPRALGQGVASLTAEPDLPAQPQQIIVSITDGLDRPAEPRYRAEVVAADGYLDLAVLRITSTLTGALVEPGDLAALQSVPLGSSDDLSSGTQIRILGHPMVAQSTAATLTEGVVAGVVADPRLNSNRAYFNLDATLRQGNSGGLAADSRGRVIGTPTLNWLGGSDTAVGAMRPIDLARPLLDAARSGEPYVSSHVTNLSGDEAIPNLRFGTASSPGFRGGCGAPGSLPRPGATELSLLLDYEGFPEGPHQDLWVAISDDTGERYIAEAFAADAWPLEMSGTGCVTVGLSLTSPLGAGDYFVDVFIGPNYQPLDEIFQFTIE